MSLESFLLSLIFFLGGATAGSGCFFGLLRKLRLLLCFGFSSGFRAAIRREKQGGSQGWERGERGGGEERGGGRRGEGICQKGDAKRNAPIIH
jgi:hypothetical protein